MSPALWGAIVGGIIGIVATVVGQVADRLLGRRGKVRCFVPYASREPPHTSPNHPLNYVVTFRFPLYFYNEKEVDIGIGELVMVFYKGGVESARSYLQEKDSDTYIRALSLPARQWVYKEIEFETGIAQAALTPSRQEAPETWEETTLTWSYPTGKTETRIIPTMGQDDPWRTHIARRRAQRRALDIY
jgi:hypothetical protein